MRCALPISQHRQDVIFNDRKYRQVDARRRVVKIVKADQNSNMKHLRVQRYQKEIKQNASSASQENKTSVVYLYK